MVSILVLYRSSMLYSTGLTISIKKSRGVYGNAKRIRYILKDLCVRPMVLHALAEMAWYVVHRPGAFTIYRDDYTKVSVIIFTCQLYLLCGYMKGLVSGLTSK